MVASIRKILLSAALSGSMLGATGPGLAQVQRQGGSTSPQLMQQYQQAIAERGSLQAENAQLKQHADELQKKLDAVTQQQSVAQRKLAGLQSQADRETKQQSADTAAAAKLQGQLTELITRYRETAQALKNVETDRGTLQAKAEGVGRELGSCVDHNANLYLLGDEILNRFEHHGFWSGAASKEPFTKISRVRLENLADDYRQRISELRLKTSTASATGTSEPTAPHDAVKP